MPLLASASPAQLPDAERAWLDPKVPLPEGVTLMRRRISSLVPLLVVLAVPFTCGVVFGAMELQAGRWGGEDTAVFPVFVGPFLGVLWAHRRRQARARALEAGTKRLGLFWGADVLLVALEEGGPCTLVPRAAMEPAASAVVLTGKGSRLDLVLSFRDEHGARGGLQVEHADLDTQRSTPELVELFNRWREGPPPSAPPAPSPPTEASAPLTDEELWSRHKY